MDTQKGSPSVLPSLYLRPRDVTTHMVPLTAASTCSHGRINLPLLLPSTYIAPGVEVGVGRYCRSLSSRVCSVLHSTENIVRSPALPPSYRGNVAEGTPTDHCRHQIKYMCHLLHTSPMARTLSMAHLLVKSTFAATKVGTRPCARSSHIAASNARYPSRKHHQHVSQG